MHHPTILYVSVFGCVLVPVHLCGHGDGGVFRELVDPPWLPLPAAPCPTHWTTTEREVKKKEGEKDHQFSNN